MAESRIPHLRRCGIARRGRGEQVAPVRRTPVRLMGGLLFAAEVWAAGPALGVGGVPLVGATADGGGVVVEVVAEGAVRLRGATGRSARAVVPHAVHAESGTEVAIAAEIRASHLWNRDAVVALELVSADGKVSGMAQTPYVVRHEDWKEVVGYGTVPAGAVAGRVVLTLNGKPKAEVDRQSFAEFRNVRVWPVPTVRLTGPELGVVRLGQPLQVTISVAGAPAGARWRGDLVDVFGTSVATWETAESQASRSFADLSPGYYEMRWRVVDAETKELRSGRSAYMVLDPAPRLDDTPWAVDAGFSWGVVQRGEEAMAKVAKLLYDCGLRRTRDRYSVGGTYAAPDKLAVDSYGRAARAQKAAGLKVYQVMHDIPAWMAPDPMGPLCRKSAPKDLRDLHRFFELAAREMRDEVDAWEVWNEPDISFFNGRPEEYAGIAKASYLGIKKGNPQARVLSGSWAHPLGDQERRFCRATDGTER